MGSKANGKIDSTKDNIDCMIEIFSTSDNISFISLSDVSRKEFFDNNLDAQVKSPTHQDDTMTISTYKVSPGEVRYTDFKNNNKLVGLSNQISEE